MDTCALGDSDIAHEKKIQKLHPLDFQKSFVRDLNMYSDLTILQSNFNIIDDSRL